jgi:hypothetical protein
MKTGRGTRCINHGARDIICYEVILPLDRVKNKGSSIIH